MTEQAQKRTSGSGRRQNERGFPRPLTILLIVILLAWIAVMFIPSGEYELDDEGRLIAGSFQEIAPRPVAS